MGGHRADTWELQAGACNHLALAKANRTELLLAEPLALALCAWLKLRPTYLHVWEKGKKSMQRLVGNLDRSRNEVEGECLTLTYPSVGLGTFLLLFIKFPFIYTCVVCCCLFFKDSKLKMEMALKAEVCGGKNSLTCIYLSLFLGL